VNNTARDLRVLAEEFNDKIVSTKDFVDILFKIRSFIADNWDGIKSMARNTKLSALGVKIHYLNFSLKLFINDDRDLNRDVAKQILAGLFISDVTPVVKKDGSYMISLNSPDPKLAASLLFSLINYLNVESVKDYVYVSISEGKRKNSVSFKHILNIRNNLKEKIKPFIITKDDLSTLIRSHDIPDYLRSWLISAMSDWDNAKVRKGVRFVWYAVNGLFGRGSVFGWFVGDGVLGHVGRGSFDVGFSFVVDDVVRAFMSDFLCRLYGCGGRFFGGSGARGSEHYVVCPVKAVVINDIISIAKSWPGYALVDRVRELLDAVNYSTPCLGYRRHPVINVLGHELILRKHNMGRGWYLTKVSSDKELIGNIANDLRVAGFDVSVREGRHGFELYVPIEGTKRILRMLGLYEKFYGEPRRLPSIDEVTKVLSSFPIKRWHVHVSKERNSRGYEYEETCLLISLGNSEAATKLREVLASVGIRVRKVVWGTVIICNPEDRELVVKALQSLGSIGNNSPK